MKDHVPNDCKYNPNTVITCDKGCNNLITRYEYEVNNCFSHLSNELKKLKDERDEQRSDVSNELNKLNEKLEEQGSDVTNEFKKINDKLDKQRSNVSSGSGTFFQNVWLVILTFFIVIIFFQFEFDHQKIYKK